MYFQVFYQEEKGSDYKNCGNGFAKPCNVLFSYTKGGNEEAYECSGTILMESRWKY